MRMSRGLRVLSMVVGSGSVVLCEGGVAVGQPRARPPLQPVDGVGGRFGQRGGEGAVHPQDRAVLVGLLPNAPAAGTRRALEEIAGRGDRRFIAPLVDLLKFARREEEYRPIVAVLRELTKDDEAAREAMRGDENPWEAMVVWVGRQESLEVSPGYAAWKGELHAQLIDPRFREFLYEGARSLVRVEEVVWGGVKVDGIPALDNPKMVAVDEADYLDDEEPVFGVSLNGDHRAYPLRILDWHEMANDVVGGRPVSLAYCTLCGAAILYDGTYRGRTVTFGSSGFLFRSNKLMYDRQTKTLWNHLTGEPVIGTLAEEGAALTTLPVVSTSWKAWREQHPETKVVSRATGFKRRYEPGAYYGEYFASPGTMFPVWPQDEARPLKERLFVARIGEVVKAYPLGAIAEAGGMVNDAVGKMDVVVIGPGPAEPVALPEAWRELSGVETAGELTMEDIRRVLEREPRMLRQMDAAVLLGLAPEVRLEVLTAYGEEGKASGRGRGRLSPALRNEVALRGLVGEVRAYARGESVFTRGAKADELIDASGARWRMTEEALEGPGGEKLSRVGGHLVYWFGWYAFYPEGDVYAARERGE